MSESPPSCFTVSRRYGTEKKAIIKSACAHVINYAYVKGVLTSVMLMLMFVLISYKKSKLRRSALVRISYVSEYLQPPDLFL